MTDEYEDDELDNQDEDEEKKEGPIKSSVYERNWAIMAHIGGLFGSFLVPLLFWLLKREFSPLLEWHGKEALNFHLTMLIALAVAGALYPVVIGLFLLIAIVIYEVVVIVRACLAANRGESYRYPLTIRFIR